MWLYISITPVGIGALNLICTYGILTGILVPKLGGVVSITSKGSAVVPLATTMHDTSAGSSVNPDGSRSNWSSPIVPDAASFPVVKCQE